MASEVDVVNLFRQGDAVPWPADGKPGFLSFKHCPHLWNLGARSNMSVSECMGLIEDIITCVNVYASREKKIDIGSTDKPNNIYIYSYQELTLYLKHLFIYLNNKIPVIPEKVKDWSWLKFIKHINLSDEYDEIIIINYNYDVWLERILEKEKITFNIRLIGKQNKNAKIKIYKPHGSISFIHNAKLENDQFQIKLDGELSDGAVDDFDISYSNLDDNYLVNALIPPAGESARFNHTWAGEIKNKAEDAVSKLTERDEIIICGLSYWYVDRAELDKLIINLDRNINLTMINPNPLPGSRAQNNGAATAGSPSDAATRVLAKERP